jgi:Mce-associated membrane protein
MRLLSRVDKTVAEEHDTGDDAAQAEAEALEAESRAAQARARADELRERADHAADGDGAPERGSVARRWRPKPASVVALTAILSGGALLAASGYLLWGHHVDQQEQQRRAAFAATASQAVVTLMSIDSAKAEDNVRQILDNSTGQFHDDFQAEADDFVKTAQESKAVTKASAQAVAVESMTEDSATVLVTAATTVSNSAGADQQPRNWRLSVDMVDDGGQKKLTKVEFIP